jgi:hypothetical protein
MLRLFVALRRLHDLIWGATFSAFGLAAGSEAYASIFGWTPALVRLYYLAGASLSVGFLALGTLVLLVPRRIALVALGVVLVQSAFMVFLVLRSPVDPDAVQVAGWSALGRDGNLRALALTINVLGTLVVLLGTFGCPGAPTSVTSVDRLSEDEAERGTADATIRVEGAGREPWQSHSMSSPPSLSREASDR